MALRWAPFCTPFEAAGESPHLRLRRNLRKSALTRSSREALTSSADRVADAKGAPQTVDSRPKTELTVQGIAASQGIAYGQIFVYFRNEVEVPSYTVEPENRIDEVARFDRALVVTRQQISKIKNEVEKNIGPEEAAIFDAHLMVLEDQALIGETIREFEASGRNIEM